MQIVTWNVNSIRARLPRALPWLEQHRPDVVCLQETKVIDDAFPREPLEDLGYNVEVFGQKTYNGVALLSRHPIESVVRGMPDDGPDAARRLIGGMIRGFVILSLYVPNGRTVGHDEYRHKLDWLRRLRAFLDSAFEPSERIVLAGDFNVTFDDRDVHDPQAWHEKILCSTPEREALGQVMRFGLEDALRKHHEEGGIYTWWHHRAAAFRRGLGLRIDHFLVSPAAREICTDVRVDVEARRGDGASDHAPVIAEFAA
jgi:exodeoxyribonuclease-3